MVILVSALMAFVFAYVSMITSAQILLLFIAIMLYGMSQIAIALTISTFFRDPRMAMQLGFFFLTVPMVAFILMVNFTGDDHFPTSMYALFWLP